ncbi:glycoside hydrolase family 55 protein [Macrococcus armenti]|uniref:glycoside hydrolase family 55 protein n=1 Tax=Macrococcus armenti TaxID=2875764 RepID=UPI001CCC8BCA|nr:glycoside hydrolase family 55 protein [Macrococcus armenti]UBH21560.1 glycoside hydrolase family 55 protein [Macrococcus armenti]
MTTYEDRFKNWIVNTDAKLDSDYYNSENNNWDVIRNMIASKGVEILSSVAFEEWLQNNEFKPKDAVATFSDLPQDAELKELRGVLDENSVYVFDGTQWVKQSNINFDGLEPIKQAVVTVKENVSKVDERTSGFINIKEFGAVGDGVTDDTQALKDAINACKKGGQFAGHAIYVPTGKYKITSMITIDAPVNIFGVSSGNNSNYNQAPQFIFENCSAFYFTNTAEYCDFNNIRLTGNKSGNIDIANNVFGYAAFNFGSGAAGVFGNMIVENFDVGYVSFTRIGDAWSGAYRFFNQVKFRQNTYNVIQKGYTTDLNFLQCDFRDSLTGKTGRIYIDSSDKDSYQSTNFVNCTFELLGTADSRDYMKYGMIIKGNSTVKVTGGYTENSSVFVDEGASYVSSAFIKMGSDSQIISGGGYVNLTGAFGHSRRFDLPDLADTSFWTHNSLTYGNIVAYDGVLGHKFTVKDNLTNPSLTTANYNKYRSLGMQTLPYNSKEAIVKLEIEYKAPQNKTVQLQLSGISESTWSNIAYYDSRPGWRRKVYCAKIPTRDASNNLFEPRPIISLPNSVIGDEYYIREVNIEIFAK